MPFSSLVSSLLLVALVSFAKAEAAPETVESKPAKTEEPKTEDARESVNEEMVIHGQMVVAKKRKALENRLRRMGYKKFVRKKGRTTIRHARPYRPTILLDDDGWMMIKRSPIRFEPPGKAAERSSKLKYLWCLPPPTVACIRIGGQVVNRRRLMTYKNRVAVQSFGYVKEWQDAIISQAMNVRLTTDIPEMLDSIWKEGLTGDDTPPLQTPKDRRSAIMEFWHTRTCVKEGAQARQLAWDFIVYEIQASEHPASRAEIEAANAKLNCSDATPLPFPGDP